MNNIESCYQVLGIQTKTSFEEIKQAYKDLVQVWHPDRYTQNPRLQQKAEVQLKDINSAYEQIMAHLTQNKAYDSVKQTQNINSDYRGAPPESQAQAVNNPPPKSTGQGSPIEQFVMSLFRLTLIEQRLLEQSIKKFTSIDAWKLERLTVVAATGGVTGVIGGPVALAAILFELGLCERYATTGSFGIGHILGCKVDYILDRELILALWVGEGEIATAIPAGKVGIKINNETASASTARAVTGVVVSKIAVKGSAKFLAKLTAKVVAKAVAKVSAKLAVKTSTGWVPLFGGFVSGGVNVWLVRGLLKAAEQYYTAQKSTHEVYLVLYDNGFVTEI